MESSSLLTLIPYLAMTAMTPFVGPIADGLVSKGWTVTNVRKLAQVCLGTFTLYWTTSAYLPTCMWRLPCGEQAEKGISVPE